MNRTYLKLVAVLAVVLILVPLVPATVMHATWDPIVDAATEAVPGGTVWVVVDVPAAGTLVKITLVNGYGDTIWATVTRTFSAAGTYNITLTLPKVLPNIGLYSDWSGRAPFMLNVSVGTDGYGERDLLINPLVEISPTYSTNIDTEGNSKSIDVEVYGLPENTYIDYIDVHLPGHTTPGDYFKYWDVGEYADENGVVEISGLAFEDLWDTAWLPMGDYNVRIYTGDSDIDENQVYADLSIGPAILMTPEAGNGMDSQTADIFIEGYGFPADAEISKIIFENQNFTGVNYEFTADGDNDTIYTDDSGYFSAEGLTPATNMSAGMYYIRVCWRAPGVPSEEVWSESGTWSYSLYASGAGGDVYKVEVTGLPDDTGNTEFGFTSYVNVSSSRDLVTEYQRTDGTDVSLDFTYGGISYRLVAEFDPSTPEVTFRLLNLTATPATEIFTVTQSTSTITVDSTDYEYANVQFNITPSVSYITDDTHPPTGNYIFYAEYYGNDDLNIGYMNLSELTYTINSANVTLYYDNSDTGTSLTFFYSTEAGNLTIEDNRFTVESGFIVDDDYNYSMTFEATFNTSDTGNFETTFSAARYTLTVPPGEEECQLFLTPGYIVRPILVVYGGPFAPGDEVTVAAYGYGPNGWSGVENWITFMWDETLPIEIVDAETAFSGNQVLAGKDGNTTFVFTIPSGESFGAHYLRGRGHWNYEYTALVIIGAQALWQKIQATLLTNLTDWKVTASHPEFGQVFASVCGNYSAQKYCGLCVKTNTGISDYLGDEIRINVTGLSPGMEIEVYFGDILVGTYTANNTWVVVDFVVPPVPAGTYPLKVKTPYAEIPVTYFYNGTGLVEAAPEVVPKIMLVSLENSENLPVLVGPGIVRVIGTGFPPGVAFESLAINGTAIGNAFNPELKNWYIDTSGTLRVYGDLEPGLFIPMLEPGVYQVSLAYWNGSEFGVTEPGYVYIINNVSNLLDKKTWDKFATKVESDLAGLVGAVTTLDSKVSALSSQVSVIASDVSGIVVTVSQINSKVESLGVTLNEVSNNVNTLLSDSATIKGDLSTIKDMISNLNLNVDLTPVMNKLNEMSGDLGDLKAGQSDIKGTLSSISSDVQTAINAANGAKSSADAAASSANEALNAVNALGPTLGSKIDSSTNILYIATIFAVLAFIFALLAWFTAKKAAAK